MQTYLANNKEYVDTNDILKIIEEYRTNNPKSKKYKSVKSKKALVDSYNLDHVFGRIINKVLAITNKYSMKYGSIFITKELYDSTFGDKPEKLESVPQLIKDKDLVFFKDDDGNVFNVEMRGERKPDKIWFKVKDLMVVFQNNNLYNVIIKPNSVYKVNDDYKYFYFTNNCQRQESTNKELYVSYDGLMKIIMNSRTGIAYQFKKYIDEIVFASCWGTKEQKVEVCKKILNIDAEQLKAIMSKSPADLCCLYLIDIKKTEDNDTKLFKYGFTDNIKRRFNEHIKTFGDNITLNKFILIPKNMLSKAETELKNCISNYSIPHNESTEIINLNKNSHGNIKNIFKIISDKYCGEHKDLINEYEKEITEYKHQLELHKQELEKKDLIIQQKDQINENLQLKLEIANMKINKNY